MRGHHPHVMLLKGGEWLRVSPHKDEVVDVGEMTRTVKTKISEPRSRPSTLRLNRAETTVAPRLR